MIVVRKAEWKLENGEITVEEFYEMTKPLDEEIRPHGEWVAREDMDYLDENKVVHNHFECKKCGFIHDFIDGHTAQYNFCPNCGADMRPRVLDQAVDGEGKDGNVKAGEAE